MGGVKIYGVGDTASAIGAGELYALLHYGEISACLICLLRSVGYGFISLVLSIGYGWISPDFKSVESALLLARDILERSLLIALS